jgi:predicted Zn-dependent peptidase
MYEISSLENGIRIVTVSMPHAYSISMGIYVAIGSRYEEDEIAGASHFIEHMLFKGTERRPTPREIALAIEGVGGDINASTGQELTTYYVRVGRDDLEIAADVLVDMLRNSRFLESDVERERRVIIEEINQSLDSPDELVYMQLQKLLWPTHPLGRDIAGSRESVSQITRQQLLDYMMTGYVPQRIVVTVAGAITHQKVCDLLIDKLSDWRGEDKLKLRLADPFKGSIARALYRPVEQSHLLLGMQAPHRTDERRFALSLLNIILGGGMSSRLFVNIREELGLAYSVYSYNYAMLETGSFVIYAAVDSKNLDATIKAILHELNLLRSKPVSDEELKMAKAYARGRTLLRLEDSGANAGWVGSQLALLDEIQRPEELLDCLDQVTKEDIQRVATDLFHDDALALSIVGPVDEEADWLPLLTLQ